MLKKLGIGCGAVVGVLVILILVISLANSGKSQPSATTSQGQVSNPQSVATVPTNGLAPPVQTPSVQVTFGTKEVPVPSGTYYNLDDHGAKLQVRVVDVVKNAKKQVKDANLFNEDPPPGNDYILVKIEARYYQGNDNEPYRTTSGGNRFYSQSRLWGAPTIAIAPDPQFDGNDIFPGATVSGWLPAKYLPSEGIDSAVLEYSGVYFGLGKVSTSSTEIKLEPLPTPDPARIASAPLGSRFRPVKLGTIISVTDRGQTLEVQVKEAVIDAAQQVKDANMFNSVAPDGYRYVLVRLQLKYVQASGTEPYKTSGDVRLYAADRLWGSPTLSVAPEPKFEGQDIFTNAVVDGWVSGRYLPKELAATAILVYQGTYFSIQK